MKPEVRHLFALALAALASSSDVRTLGALGAQAGFAPAPVTLTEDPPPPSPPASAAWSLSLPALHFHNANTEKDGTFRLYTPDGTFDEAAAAELDRVLAPRDAPPRPLHRRLLKLIVKAADHFHKDAITVISTFRDRSGRRSRHRTGEAIDFILDGVKSTELAALLRTYARVGVGVYTHPRTQFVHLDVRDESYHWVDASPPGHAWREMSLPDRSAAARDAAFTPEADLPAPSTPGSR